MATEIVPWCETKMEFYIMFSIIVSLCFVLYFRINPLHLVLKKQTNNIKYKYKKVLINSILAHFGEELKYHPIIKTNKNQFNRSKIFKKKVTKKKIYCAIAVNKNLFEISLRKSFDIQKHYILSEAYLLFCILQGLKILQKNIYSEILQKS